MTTLQRLLWILACLGLPVVWGYVVHALFEWWRTRDRDDDRDGTLPDFQI